MTTPDIEYQFVVNVQICAIHNDKILMIRRGQDESHAPGVLDIPGGKLELIDSDTNCLEVCAKRELLEETNLDFEGRFDYITSAKFVADDGVAVINIVMKAVLDSNTSYHVSQGADEIDCLWVPVTEIEKSSEIPNWTKGYISAAIAG